LPGYSCYKAATAGNRIDHSAKEPGGKKNQQLQHVFGPGFMDKWV
jgi:hypothetical protein